MKLIVMIVLVLSTMVTSAQHSDTCHIDFPVVVTNPFSEGTSDMFAITSLSNLDSIHVLLLDSNHQVIGDTVLSNIKENSYIDLKNLITPFRRKKDTTVLISCAAIYWIDGLQYSCASHAILYFSR